MICYVKTDTMYCFCNLRPVDRLCNKLTSYTYRQRVTLHVIQRYGDCTTQTMLVQLHALQQYMIQTYC